MLKVIHNDLYLDVLLSLYVNVTDTLEALIMTAVSTNPLNTETDYSTAVQRQNAVSAYL